MHRQCEHLNDCLRKKELELSQLKKQYQISNNTSQISNSSAELESRVRSLATSLIQKQGAVEALIAERNSLRLKLERFEVWKLIIFSCNQAPLILPIDYNMYFIIF
jgi:hypothetical protein